MADFQLNEQQQQALKLVEAWLKDKSRPQIFRLFGFAGTGKTTIARMLTSSVSNVLFAAYTGKAALQLRKRGCTGASTLHSLIYKVEQDPQTGKLLFAINYESALATADVLAIDEVSMVDDGMAEDLLSFGKPILVLGDPAQLPPVKGSGYFINAQPDVLLTDIRRQAADNPIIALAALVRAGKPLTAGLYGDTVEILSRQKAKRRYEELLLSHDMVIAGTNSSRIALNMQARQAKGLIGTPEAWHPVAADRLICLRNDRKKGLLNGSLWSVKGVEATEDTFEFQIVSEDFDIPVPLQVSCLKEYFSGQDAALDWKLKVLYDEFTYGQAITCHKAQGSQWPKPLVLDQSAVFKESASKWLYTAITRAEEGLTVILDA